MVRRNDVLGAVVRYPLPFGSSVYVGAFRGEVDRDMRRREAEMGEGEVDDEAAAETVGVFVWEE